jgi:sulfite exporter TauE/SafE
MARYRAYVVLAVGVLLILIGLFQGDSADWVQVVQIIAGVILLVDGALALGRESGSA